jgi:TonB family protein
MRAHVSSTVESFQPTEFPMRSKMLGLAIALSTFGLGVAATTLWIARHTQPVPQVIVMKRIVDVPSVMSAPPEQLSPCDARNVRASSASAPPVSGVAISGGVLNGKAISKPSPAYPPIARAAHTSGSVVVQVKVDECGNVVSAKAISGPPLLQQAAVEAAYAWRFTPTLLAGEPVKVTGTITFNFLLQ